MARSQPSLATLRAAIRSHADPSRVGQLQRYFKTAPGDYGEGDQFLGLMVPMCRKLARQFREQSLSEVVELLHSAIHEDRLIALFILVQQFERGTEAHRRTIFEIYLASTKFINNWDLVDTSAPQIVGGYLLELPRQELDKLVQSTSLWERRIAVLATLAFIKHDQFNDTLRLAHRLLTDPHDLMHKAVGWMLREVGNRNQSILIGFLENQAQHMPRTMLRYAIEKLPAPRRAHYLALPRVKTD